MTDTVTFRVEFHTPFRVATGSAGDGADTVVDRKVPVPGPTVKGLMRAAARDVLGGKGPRQDGGDHPLVVEVFGDTPSAPGRDDGDSPWHWNDVEFDTAPAEPVLGNRIRIDPDTGTVARGALMVAQQLPPAVGRIEIWRSGQVPTTRLAVHQALLRLCAALVDSAGGDRRAGLGWVSLSPVAQEPPPDWPALVDLVLAEADPALAETAVGASVAGTVAARGDGDPR